MSKSIAKIYTNAVKKNQRTFYGVWEPGYPIKLGDFGVMDGNIFVHLGNIFNFEELKNFNLKIREDDTKDEKFFTSENGVNWELKPQMAGNLDGVKINAALEIKFSKKDCIFFNGAECVFEIIENKNELGSHIMSLPKSLWKKDYVVVTDRVITKRALILISTSQSYSITLEADANVPAIDLAKASLGLKVSKESSGGYKVITEQGIVPLIGLCKIQTPFLSKETFKAYKQNWTKSMMMAHQNYAIEQDTEIEEQQFLQFSDDLEE